MTLRDRTTITDRQRYADGTESWTETTHSTEGDSVRLITASASILTRTNCFCCSCTDTGASDPYCRNHGFAGERPCEDHKMPGQVDEEGRMPASVQSQRAKNVS